MNQQLVFIIATVAAMAWIIVNQLRRRPLRGRWLMPLVLAGVGIASTASYLSLHGADRIALLWIAGSIVIGSGLAVLRGLTVRLWVEDGIRWQQGRLLTVALWVVAFGQHVLIDRVAGALGQATFLLYLAVVFAVQRIVVSRRGQQLVAGEPSGKAGGAGSRPLIGVL